VPPSHRILATLLIDCVQGLWRGCWQRALAARDRLTVRICPSDPSDDDKKTLMCVLVIMNTPTFLADWTGCTRSGPSWTSPRARNVTATTKGAHQMSSVLAQFVLTENDGHKIDGHEIDGPRVQAWNWRTSKWRTWNWRTRYIYRLKIDYITMQCAILFKTTAKYKSQQRSKL